VQQRTLPIVSASAAITYTFDRWQVLSNGDTVTVSSQTGGPDNSTAPYMQCVMGAASSYFFLSQILEQRDCFDLRAGTPITISGWIKSDSAAITLPLINLWYLNNPDNSPAGSTPVMTAQSIGLLAPGVLVANTWTYFSNTFTLTNDAVNGLQFYLYFLTGAPGRTISFANMQIEKGLYATPFERIPYDRDFQACKRYYQISSWANGGYGTAGMNFYSSIQINPGMRITPTVVLGGASYVNSSGLIVSGSAINSINIEGTVTAAGAYIAQATAVTLSADL